MRRSVIRQIQQAVADCLCGDHPIVLAVSGGVDSTVLLDAAAESVRRDRICVATFDHGTGPAASEAVVFVRRRASELGLECIFARATGALRSEAALRDSRWQFLRATASVRNARVATAHTIDDQIETVLMRVLRGAGARGIAGLFAPSDVHRPLLHVSRGDVLRYARARGINWIEDPSNGSRSFLRNRVRHDLLPALRRADPELDRRLLDLAADAAAWRRDVTSFVDRALAVRLLVSGTGLDVGAELLSTFGLRELKVLWPEIVSRVGLALDRRGTERLARFTHDARVGARVQLSGGWQVVRSRDAFQLRASELSLLPDAVTLSRTTVTRWESWAFRPIRTESAADLWSAWMPPKVPVVVRRWQPGDAMLAHTGGTPRKVKYFLSDAGITGHERRRWPVVLANDEIIWIPGVRRSPAATARSGRPSLAFACEYISR